MDLELDAEHLDLREAARGFLERHAPLTARHDPDPAGLPELYSAVAGQGWLDLGSGTADDLFGVVGAALTAMELGRQAVPIPFAEHVAISRAVAASDAAFPVEWPAGSSLGTLAALEKHCDWSLEGLRARAEHGDDGWRLSGGKTSVPLATTADTIGVIATTDHGLGLFVLARDDQGVSLDPERSFDPTRPSWTVAFDDTPVPDAAAYTGAGVAPALHAALSMAAVITAAEAYGAADALLDVAVAYAKDREQFGRPIGSFQAVQHILADLHVLRETTWWTVLNAATTIDGGRDPAGWAAGVAAAHASTATRQIGEGALQVLGGIGFSNEHDAHLLFGRVLECEQRFGDALTHESRLVDQLRGGVVPR